MNERRREEILLFSWPQRDVDRMQLSVMSGLARQRVKWVIWLYQHRCWLVGGSLDYGQVRSKTQR